MTGLTECTIVRENESTPSYQSDLRSELLYRWPLKLHITVYITYTHSCHSLAPPIQEGSHTDILQSSFGMSEHWHRCLSRIRSSLRGNRKRKQVIDKYKHELEPPFLLAGCTRTSDLLLDTQSLRVSFTNYWEQFREDKYHRRLLLQLKTNYSQSVDAVGGVMRCHFDTRLHLSVRYTPGNENVGPTECERDSFMSECALVCHGVWSIQTLWFLPL